MRHFAIASALAIALLGTAAATQSTGHQDHQDHQDHPPTTNSSNTAEPAPAPSPAGDDAPVGQGRSTGQTSNDSNTLAPPPQ